MADESLKRTATDDEAVDEMARHGITCVPMNNYYYRGFHYTNLKDAIAQSMRDRIRLGLMPDA